jgi:hypothetical protein
VSVEVEVIGEAPLDSNAEQTMVPMRDGVQLATDVYLPDDAKVPTPAVLVRQPYDKVGRYTFMQRIAPYFTDRGYAFVVQDVRGKFRSEGETHAFVAEIDDGYDTLEWVSTQPWCDGAVGMWGDSYYGYTQWAAVASEHPALRAIVPRVTSADLAGAFGPERVIPLYLGEYLAQYWLDRLIHRWEVDYSRRPLAEVFDPGFEAVGARSRSFDDLVRESVSGQSLAPFPGAHPFDVLRIPTLHTGGWFDNLMPDQMRDYVELVSRPGIADLQYLEMNSTDHENYFLGLVPVGPEDDHDSNDTALARMLPRYLGAALDFFDIQLRGIDALFPRVQWHQGNDDWHTAERWPPPDAQPMRLYLTAADRATVDADGGGLSSEPDERGSEVRWTHEPGDLVPSTVRDPFAFLHEAPDERVVASRPDVLTFTSAVLDAPLDLAGPIEAQLAVRSTAPSTAVFAKLVDVAPDGAALMLTRGQTMVLITEGSVVTRIDLAHMGYRVPAGHRLRLQLASSDFPLYLPHPGTDEDPWQATSGKPSEQTLTAGGEDGSLLRLTVRSSA